MDVEQVTLLWVFRGVYLALSAIIAIFTWRYMRRERFIHRRVAPEYIPPQDVTLPEKTIALTVMAKPGRYFDNLRLFKRLHELGFVYGDNGVFEYLLKDGKTVAFSILNIRHPGVFAADPNQMRPTNGVLAVMQLPLADGYNQVKYFHLLLSILEELRMGLDAILSDGHRKALRNNMLYDIQNEIERFEQQYSALIQNDYNQRKL